MQPGDSSSAWTQNIVLTNVCTPSMIKIGTKGNIRTRDGPTVLHNKVNLQVTLSKDLKYATHTF